nr:thioesterase superfamily [uncultured bacterium]
MDTAHFTWGRNSVNVVLGSAETRFLAPVVVGESLLATATVTRVEGKKHYVEVDVLRSEIVEAGESAREQHGGGASEPARVFQGTFVCFVPAKHVLAARGTR